MPDDTDPLTPGSDSDDRPRTTEGGDDTTALSADDLARAMRDDDTPVPPLPATPSARDTATEALTGVTSSSAVGAAGAPRGAPGAGGSEITIENTPSTHAQHRRQRASVNRRWVIGLIALAVALAGSGVALAVSDSNNHSATPPAGPSAPAVATTSPPSGPACPLTGLPGPGGHVPARPALAIKIDNYPQARPQSGLNQADLVFEEPVEGGITRLVAVFQCQGASLIGPVRSARAVDAQILGQLSKPLFVHAGGIDPVLSLINNADVVNDDVFTHASLVQNPPDRYAPYDTYVSSAAVWALNPTDTSAPTPLFNYSSTTPSGTAVTSVHIPFSSTNDDHWNWNASSGKWQLFFGREPALVANGGQIATSNIVIQTVQVSYGPWAENSAGALEVQSKMTGSGPLMVLRNGIAITGTWHRESVDDPTILTDSNGSPISLQPGPTWIEIVPSTVSVTTTEPTPSN